MFVKNYQQLSKSCICPKINLYKPLVVCSTYVLCVSAGKVSHPSVLDDSLIRLSHTLRVTNNFGHKHK